MGKATDYLKKEHDTIFDVLKGLDKVMVEEAIEEQDRIQQYKDFICFFKKFAQKHQQKEADYLFEELAAGGLSKESGQLGGFITEHSDAEQYLALMDQALEQNDLEKFNVFAEKYGSLLMNHLFKEDLIMFSLAEGLLDDQKEEEILAKFHQTQIDLIEDSAWGKVQEVIDKWQVKREEKEDTEQK